jgi:hypothetical protein
MTNHSHPTQEKMRQVRFMLSEDALSRLDYVAQLTGCNLSSLVEKAILLTLAPPRSLETKLNPTSSSPSIPINPTAAIGKETNDDQLTPE